MVHNTHKLPIAIVGATGLVGKTLLSLLEERDFPFSELYLIASEQSSGKKVRFKGKTYTITDLAAFDFSKTKIAFFCVNNSLASIYIPKAVTAGNVVIDKSYYFRNHKDVPLVIPEINIDAIDELAESKIIASPNCNTIPIAVALKAIYDAVGISRINVATYQSVSGTGKDAITELLQQTKQHLEGNEITSQVYPQQIAFNVLPHIDDFEENGYTREEMKIVWEMKKIFRDDELAINPTAVRVPVLCGHAAAVHLETKNNFSIEEVKKLLSNAPGVSLLEGEHTYPTPAVHAAGNDWVHVGRLRKDISHPKGLNLWVVADNLRKGAALNALQIAEYLIKHQKVI